MIKTLTILNFDQHDHVRCKTITLVRVKFIFNFESAPFWIIFKTMSLMPHICLSVLACLPLKTTWMDCPSWNMLSSTSLSNYNWVKIVVYCPWKNIGWHEEAKKQIHSEKKNSVFVHLRDTKASLAMQLCVIQFISNSSSIILITYSMEMQHLYSQQFQTL